MKRPHARYRRTPSTEDGEPIIDLPVVLPLVVMTIRSDATMTVTVDGEPYEPPPFGPPWGRGSFAAILDELTGQHYCPVRVEVREVDGTVFTDIITPSTRLNRTLGLYLAPQPESPPKSATTMPVEALPTVSGEGFLPGEDVAVAIIVAHTDAATDGTARSLVTGGMQASSPTREVILLGRVSGTLTVTHPR